MSAAPFDDTASAVDIVSCFRLILGRNPNPEELAGHLGLIGQPLPGVVANYLNSAEFNHRGLIAARSAGEIRKVTTPDYDIYVPVADEAVGRHVAHGVYEPDVAAVLRRWLRPGMGMLDLGANLGVFALLGAALVGPSGHVLAMEPNPANARLLEASRLANGFAHLTLCQAAASRSVGVLALHSFDSNGTATMVQEESLLAALTVAALPVDLVARPEQRVNVIKIDVEGAEHVALSGASGLLGRCCPAIVSEFSPGQLAAVSGVAGPDYLRFLMGHGYQLGVIGPGGTYEPGLSVEAVMTAYQRAGVDHIDIVAVPPEPAADMG